MIPKGRRQRPENGMNQRVSVIPEKAGIQAHLQGIPYRTSVSEGTGSASVHGLFSDKKYGNTTC